MFQLHPVTSFCLTPTSQKVRLTFFRVLEIQNRKLSATFHVSFSFRVWRVYKALYKVDSGIEPLFVVLELTNFISSEVTGWVYLTFIQ